MSNYHQNKWDWKKFRKGSGIRVVVPNDLDENGKQKYRPGIVIKAYPSHVKVQLMSTQPSKFDYFLIMIDNQTQYIRPVYFRTVNINMILQIFEKTKAIAALS